MIGNINAFNMMDILKTSIDQQQHNAEITAVNSANMIEAIKELKNSVDQLTSVVRSLLCVSSISTQDMNKEPNKQYMPC